MGSYYGPQFSSTMQRRLCSRIKLLSADSASCPCVPVHLFTTKGVAFGWTTEGRRSIGTWLTAYNSITKSHQRSRPTGMGGVGPAAQKRNAGKGKSDRV